MTQPVHRVFISYCHADRGRVKPAVRALEDQGVSIYVDTHDTPLEDPHSLEVGLSEGLARSSRLVAFISRAYLQSSWCRGELREFIFLHGARVEDPEGKTGYGRHPSYEYYDRRVALPAIPGLLVLLDESISPEEVAEAVTPEDRMADFSYRVAAYRGDTGRSRRMFCLDYVRRRGIDASHYVKNMELYDASRFRAKEVASAVESWLSTGSDLARDDTRSLKAEDVGSLWARVCSEYPHSKFAGTVDPLAVVGSIDLGPLDSEEIGIRIASHSDELLVSLFGDILIGRQSGNCFDRTGAEGFSPAPSYSHLLPRLPVDADSERAALEYLRGIMSQGHIRPERLQGHPLDHLVSLARQRKLLRPIQYSYYAMVERGRRNSSVDAAAIAGLLVNIDTWYEVIRDMETLRELITEPLNQLRDIRSLFPW